MGSKPGTFEDGNRWEQKKEKGGFNSRIENVVYLLSHCYIVMFCRFCSAYSRASDPLQVVSLQRHLCTFVYPTLDSWGSGTHTNLFSHTIAATDVEEDIDAAL